MIVTDYFVWRLISVFMVHSIKHWTKYQNIRFYILHVQHWTLLHLNSILTCCVLWHRLSNGSNVKLDYLTSSMPLWGYAKESVQLLPKCYRTGRLHPVAAHVRAYQSTISHLYEWLRTTGTRDDCPRRGDPRVTTELQEWYTGLVHLRNRFRKQRETAATIRGLCNIRISARNVRNCLRDVGIQARRSYVGLVLNQKRCQWRRPSWPRMLQ